MRQASYVYRMDDIHPAMEREMFLEYITVFRNAGIKPLLGVIPSCGDQEITCGKPDPEFWQKMRSMQKEGIIEIAMHGYTHVYSTNRTSLANRLIGNNVLSEFYGLPYEQQDAMIREGKRLLAEQGIDTDIFMAPSHSFDSNTCRALAANGFHFVTDGIGIHPFRKYGLTFVPQQYWAPVYKRSGIRTICIHHSEGDKKLLQDVKEHIGSGAVFVSFTEAAATRVGLLQRCSNLFFSAGYIASAVIRGILQ